MDNNNLLKIRKGWFALILLFYFWVSSNLFMEVMYYSDLFIFTSVIGIAYLLTFIIAAKRMFSDRSNMDFCINLPWLAFLLVAQFITFIGLGNQNLLILFFIPYVIILNIFLSKGCDPQPDVLSTKSLTKEERIAILESKIAQLQNIEALGKTNSELFRKPQSNTSKIIGVVILAIILFPTISFYTFLYADGYLQNVSAQKVCDNFDAEYAKYDKIHYKTVGDYKIKIVYPEKMENEVKVDNSYSTGKKCYAKATLPYKTYIVYKDKEFYLDSFTTSSVKVESVNFVTDSNYYPITEWHDKVDETHELISVDGGVVTHLTPGDSYYANESFMCTDYKNTPCNFKSSFVVNQDQTVYGGIDFGRLYDLFDINTYDRYQSEKIVGKFIDETAIILTFNGVKGTPFCIDSGYCKEYTNNGSFKTYTITTTFIRSDKGVFVLKDGDRIMNEFNNYKAKLNTK